MTTCLKQSTATDVELGPFVDSADGITPETALTISQADCQLIKNGGAAAQKNDATSATHLAGGHYKVPLNATDTGTLGRLRLYVNESGAVPIWRDFMVVPANVFDSYFSTDRLQVHVDEMTAGIITAAVIAADAFTAAKFAADVTTELQSGLATSAALTTIASYIDTEVASILSIVTTIAGYLDTEIAAILAAVDTEVAAIKAKTDNLPASPAAVGSAMTLATDAVNAAALAASAVAEIQAGLSTLTASQVNAEVVDALDVDTYAELTGVPAATASPIAMVRFLYLVTRNKHVTSATHDRIRNDADSADVATAALSDDGTAFTRGEYS